MDDIYFVDGQYVPAEEAVLPVSDLAILRGYGIFDFMRTYKRIPFHLEDHVDRLFNSAATIDMVLPWSKEEIIAITEETISRNPHHDELNVRIVVTGGTSPDFLNPAGNPRLLVMCTKCVPPAQRYYNDGAKIITIDETRYEPQSKNINYVPAIRALMKARATDAVEAIYMNPSTHVLEGTTTNLFIFKENVLITPDDEILNGITRKVVLDLAEPHYKIELRPVNLDELYAADEAFLTASNKQVMPVVQVNDRKIGSGHPGELTRHIMTLFSDLTGETLFTN